MDQIEHSPEQDDIDDRIGFFPQIVRCCAGILSNEGPLAVLAYLNGRTRFRFSGIYRADPPLLENLYLYDRENPGLDVSGESSLLDDTYCAIVVADAAVHSITDSRKDPRLAAHAARERVISYCGVPIRRDTGAVWGTICHFDVRPRLLPRAEAEVLEQVAAMLAPTLSKLVLRR